MDINRINMIHCKKVKKTGIDRVRQLLHVNPNTGEALLEVDPSCHNFIYEMLHYANKKSPDGRILDEPAQGNDHLMDALEYLAATSYEDVELRRDRVGMLDMKDDRKRLRKKPLEVHQLLVKRIRDEADDADDEDDDLPEADYFNDEEDEEDETYLEFDNGD